MGYSLGIEDLEVVPLLKSLVTELLGTMFLVIIGCGTAMRSPDVPNDKAAVSLFVFK